MSIIEYDCFYCSRNISDCRDLLNVSLQEGNKILTKKVCFTCLKANFNKIVWLNKSGYWCTILKPQLRKNNKSYKK